MWVHIDSRLLQKPVYLLVSDIPQTQVLIILILLLLDHHSSLFNSTQILNQSFVDGVVSHFNFRFLLLHLMLV